MTAENPLIVGFSDIDTERISAHLKRLIPYLTPNKFAIVGGIAIRYHLFQHNIPYPKRAFNDLDIIAEDDKVVSPSITRDFLVYHRHLQKEDSFYFALVDPISKTKVDIFDYKMKTEKFVKASFHGQEILIPSIEDQLVKTVFDIQRVSEEAKVDPKQFLDAKLLMQIADINISEDIWRRRRFNQYPASLTGAVKRAEVIAQQHPEWLQEKPFKKQQPYKCRVCVSTPEFPLTSMEEIYPILGMIE